MKKLFILLFSFLSFASYSQKFAFSLHLEKGKTYRHLASSKSTVLQEVNGQQTEMTMIVRGATSYLVKNVVNNLYTIDVTYDSLFMAMSVGEITREFSSEIKNESDVYSGILNSMKNKPFQIDMTNTGKVTEVRNMESLFSDAISKSGIDEAQKAAMIAQMKKAFGAEALKGSIEMITAIFPASPVDKGDSWTIHTKLQTGMEADMTTVYTMTEKASNYVALNGESKILSADKDAYIQTNGMPIRYDLTGTMHSDIRIDPATGWVISSNISQSISGTAYIKENEQMPQGMTIPITTKAEMKFTNGL
jgi:hypothetical protein